MRGVRVLAAGLLVVGTWGGGLSWAGLERAELPADPPAAGDADLEAAAEAAAARARAALDALKAHRSGTSAAVVDEDAVALGREVLRLLEAVLADYGETLAAERLRASGLDGFSVEGIRVAVRSMEAVLLNRQCLRGERDPESEACRALRQGVVPQADRMRLGEQVAAGLQAVSGRQGTVVAEAMIAAGVPDLERVRALLAGVAGDAERGSLRERFVAHYVERLHWKAAYGLAGEAPPPRRRALLVEVSRAEDERVRLRQRRLQEVAGEAQRLWGSAACDLRVESYGAAARVRAREVPWRIVVDGAADGVVLEVNVFDFDRGPKAPAVVLELEPGEYVNRLVVGYGERVHRLALETSGGRSLEAGAGRAGVDDADLTGIRVLRLGGVVVGAQEKLAGVSVVYCRDYQAPLPR